MNLFVGVTYNRQEPKPNYRHHTQLERASEEQSRDTYKTLHDCRGPKIMKVSEQINGGASIPAAGVTTRVCPGVSTHFSHPGTQKSITFYPPSSPYENYKEKVELKSESGMGLEFQLIMKRNRDIQ
ncbi:hypothetical protein EVAR_89868_1 [Eumeta japonica]|uniref:Uncharacterized protein n=1 Tax=Eumeta variegata TaxID=151549 RepID=A0A4C1ZLX1_EUMVA|nr:hypothetical protein EVAR_89868_1 [Eumeta japonica]